MSLPPADPDDLVRRKVDYEHIKNMTHQMQVPDSITVAPRSSGYDHFHGYDERLPPRMEVPDRLRPGGNDSMLSLNENEFYGDFPRPNPTDLSLPATLHPAEIDPPNDEIDLPPMINNRDTNGENRYSIEPFHSLDEKQLLNKLQLLQNRVYFVERTLARRQSRDRILFTCLFGCAVVQLILSFRRSMFN